MGVTAVIVVASVIGIARSKSKIFDSSFSTVLGTTRNPELDALVASSGSSGVTALAKHLANTKLRLLDSQPMVDDVVNGKDEHGSAPRTFFIVVKGNEPGRHGDDLAEQSVGYHKGEMRPADMDSLLVVEEESHHHEQARVSLPANETPLVLDERLVGR